MFLPVQLLNALSVLLPALPLLIVFHCVLHRRAKKSQTKIPKRHLVATYVFCFALSLILSVTGVPSLSHLIRSGIKIDAHINIIPFVDIATNTEQYIQNLFLFVPLGLLLPALWARFDRKRPTFFLGSLFSFFIESLQLFNYRAPDIDDLIMNTLGTVAGYFLFQGLKKWFPKASVTFRRDETSCSFRWETYFYFVSAWVASFIASPYVLEWIWALFGRRVIFLF